MNHDVIELREDIRRELTPIIQTAMESAWQVDVIHWINLEAILSHHQRIVSVIGHKPSGELFMEFAHEFDIAAKLKKSFRQP